MLQAIGTVITHWAYLEALIEDLTAGFMSAELTHVYTLTANINISTRLPAAVALAKLRLESDDDLAEFQSLTKRVQTLAGFRNKVVHGLWAETGDPDIALVAAIKSAGKLKYQVEYINVQYLQWLDEQAHDVASQLLRRFGRRFGLLGGEWPDSPSSLPQTSV
jgi:hypothetical protein